MSLFNNYIDHKTKPSGRKLIFHMLMDVCMETVSTILHVCVRLEDDLRCHPCEHLFTSFEAGSLLELTIRLEQLSTQLWGSPLLCVHYAGKTVHMTSPSIFMWVLWIDLK